MREPFTPSRTERQLFTWDDPATDDERDTAIGLILRHLKLKIVETNATKHGNVEMQLQPDE